MKIQSVKNALRVSFLPLALAPFFMACSTSNSDQVYNAQNCLDHSTQANAMNCYSMVAGNNSTAAYLIRCSAILLYEGVSNPAALQTVVTDLTGGGTPVASAASALAFTASAGTGNTSNATDVAQAADAVVECSASLSTGLSTLATLSSISTVASNLFAVAGTSITAANINSKAPQIVAALPQLPNLLANSYAQNCSGTISSANQSFCAQYAAALTGSGGNSTTAATNFLGALH